MEYAQHFHENRLLQTDNSTQGSNSADSLTETEIIKTTCAVYGSIFAALFIVFLIVRPRYPHVYNLKKSFPAFHTPVADDAFGRISWMWKVFTVSYDDIRDQCGMDAMTTVRLLEFGVKLSLVGVFNSIFLLPIYGLMGDVVANEGVSDPIKEVSLSNLGQGSNFAIVTTFSAYILFGAAMYFIAKDFEWFTAHRHTFLSKKRVQNYSIFLSGLPPEMQNNRALREYFAICFSHNAVADVHVALAISNLEKKVAKRNALLPKLEHSINVLTIKGETPMHKAKICGGEKVWSVPAYSKEIADLNEEIDSRRKKLESMQEERENRASNGDVETGEDEMQLQPDPEETDIFDEHPEQGSKIAMYSKSFKSSASKMKAIITGGEDGAPRNAAFVSFADLTSANIARQTVHQSEPWSCVPVEPPMPELVNWKNVGKSNNSKQIGELISLVLTSVLCIFWTIPVGIVASLSNVEGLTELLPFLKAPVETYAWFSSLLALLAPLLLVVFVSLLPMILLTFLKFEGLIEMETYQHPSLFSKLASFTIIQTFFISTIASTLSKSLQQILDKPRSIFAIVGSALPAQSAYFIQIIIVQNLLALGIELLRISPVAQNIIRKVVAKKLAHNLTEKERNESFMGLRSLEAPLEYYFGRELGGKIILVQMVLYVYGCMSPITTYFTLIVFGLLAIGFRHQFLYIYPIANDSGGKLWINFQRLSVTCMILAEIILGAVLLLKEVFIAAVLMVPLITTTILFDIYLKRRHYSVTCYLPMGECATIDHNNESEGITYESFKDAYLQPELKEMSSALLPENYFEIATARKSEENRHDEVAVDETRQSGDHGNESYEVVVDETRQSGDHGSESSDRSRNQKKHKKHQRKESNDGLRGESRSQEKERKRKKKSKKEHRKKEYSQLSDSGQEPERKSKKEHRHCRRENSFECEVKDAEHRK